MKQAKYKKITETIVHLLRRSDVLLFLFCFALFTLNSSLDLAVSQYFYDQQLHVFGYKNSAFNHFVYVFIQKLPLILLIVLPVLAIINYRRYPHNNRRKWTYSFLLLALLLGPGLLVNTIIKDNSIGRARPSQIIDFNGTQTFTPAFVYSGQCKKNCSFVSGHAAMGFYFIALAWVFASPPAFYSGVFIGALTGLVRIMQGGHFLSDVIFAFWAVYLVTVLLAKLFKLTHPLVNVTKAPSQPSFDLILIPR